jgi:FKBP-type peptidyl-prolyl cis-trans isomerase SlyD
MKAQVVSFHCVLKNKLGQILSTSSNLDVLTSTSTPDAPLQRLTEGLQGIRSGEKRRIFIPAEQAYGFYRLDQVIKMPLEDFSNPPKLGEHLRLSSESPSYRVTEIKSDQVTLDGNHPLAGQDLIFEIEAIKARPALPEEIGQPDLVTDTSMFH